MSNHIRQQHLAFYYCYTKKLICLPQTLNHPCLHRGIWVLYFPVDETGKALQRNFDTYIFKFLKNFSGPDRCGSVGWASLTKWKVASLIPSQGPCLGCSSGPNLGCTKGTRGNGSMFLSHLMFLSLSPPFPPPFPSLSL